jgi:hypothetical protein
MGGHIIIRNDTRDALLQPLVWAGLPSITQSILRQIFYNTDGTLRDGATWTAEEAFHVGAASLWANCYL